MEILNDNDWRLQSIDISFQEWGDYKGKYIGKIGFQNKHREAFSFNIPPEKATQFLALIRENVIESAKNLGDRVLQSLPALQMATPASQIEDIQHEENK